MKQLYYSSLDSKMKAQREEMNYFQEAQDLQREVQRAQKLNVNLRELADKNLTKVVSKVIEKQTGEKLKEPAGVLKLFQIISTKYPYGFKKKDGFSQSEYSMIRDFARKRGFEGPDSIRQKAFEDNSELDKFLKKIPLTEAMTELTPYLEAYKAKKRGRQSTEPAVANTPASAPVPLEATPPFAEPLAEE